MKILVATKEKQVLRDDFCWTNEGEIVRLPLVECSKPDCGCDRSWVGVESSKSTTTAKVIQSKFNFEALSQVIYMSRIKEGWINTESFLFNREREMEICKEMANKIHKITKYRKVGTIVRRKYKNVFNEE
jgi:hypothetical protein